MVHVTPNKKNTLDFYKRRVDEIEASTKHVTLDGGPFDNSPVRISEQYSHFASTVPESLAKKYPPLEFDGVPDVPEPLVFVAEYQPKTRNIYAFEGIQVYKQTNHNKDYPLGYERVRRD